VSLSPLQNKILELSAKVIETEDPAEFARLTHDLRQALQEQMAVLRSLVGEARRNISQMPSLNFETKTGTDS
jgi:hypothetical protein